MSTLGDTLSSDITAVCPFIIMDKRILILDGHLHVVNVKNFFIEVVGIQIVSVSTVNFSIIDCMKMNFIIGLKLHADD